MSTPITKVEATDYFKAARLIDKHGLAKNELKDAKGRLCAIGAINVARTGSHHWVEHYPLHMTIVGFNNRARTTPLQVCMLLEFLGHAAQP